MPSIPFRMRSFFKNFGWQEVNYCSFSLLFKLFIFWSFLWFLVIIPFWEICSSSFCLLVCVKVICLSSLYSLLSIFVFCIVPQGFFLFVSSIFWLMTPTSSTSLVLFPLFLIILSLGQCLWGQSLNLTSVQLSPLQASLLVFPFLGFCWPPNNIKVLAIPFGSTSYFFFFLQATLDEDVCHIEMFPRLGDV